MTRLAAILVSGLVLLSGCRADAVDAMSRTTVLVDAQFAPPYRAALEACIEESSTREEYDACAAPWHAAADAVEALVNVTRTLDVAQGRRAFKGTACRWFDALGVVQATSPVYVPAVEAGLLSRWRRRC